jgi:transcriptional activator for dhaKLM operon
MLNDNYEAVRRAWAAFRQRPLVDSLEPSPAVPPVIFDSWRRCKVIFEQEAFAVRLPEEELEAAHTRLEAAIPYLEDIHQLLRGEPGAVFLTDAAGTVLAIEGEVPGAATQHQIGLGVGERWAERAIGTNAVGLALQTAMPVQVVGVEHYLQIFHEHSDAAAPIHDEHGVIIGAVGFVTTLGRANPAQLALVMTTARAITAQLHADVMLEQANQRLRQLNHILESVTEGVVTWDTNGTIDHINDKACQILGVGSAALLGRSITGEVEFSDYIRSLIDQRRELSDVETPIRIADRIVRCLISVRAVRDGVGEVIGGIAMLRTASQVHSWLNQQTSSLSAMTFDDLQFTSRQMVDLMRQAEVAARGALPVLIHGENGVGKTTLVQAIHNAGPRGTKPLVVVNCGMVPNEFMVEELLGREAHGNELGRPSKFELADGSTLLFDQIDQLSLEAQQILLGVMNSRTVTRLHARRTSYVNVRIIATTAQDIGELTRMGGFLPQLYYLFNVFTLRVAPLRERREDIVQLAERFLDRTCAGQPPLRISPAVYEVLQLYPWPGNVRELENVIERAVMHANSTVICVEDLPQNILTDHSLQPDAVVPDQVISLEEAERAAIVRAGWAYRGVVSAMANALGINRSTLWRKFKQYRLNADDFKGHTS